MNSFANCVLRRKTTTASRRSLRTGSRRTGSGSWPFSKGQFEWDQLVKLVEQEAPAVAIPVQWRRALPTAHEEALYVHARRCGDLVDALATVPPASNNGDQQPVIVTFARRLLQIVTSAELSDDMRRWIDATRPRTDA